jgi:hypothetical protein
VVVYLREDDLYLSETVVVGSEQREEVAGRRGFVPTAPGSWGLEENWGLWFPGPIRGSGAF